MSVTFEQASYKTHDAHGSDSIDVIEQLGAHVGGVVKGRVEASVGYGAGEQRADGRHRHGCQDAQIC